MAVQPERVGKYRIIREIGRGRDRNRLSCRESVLSRACCLEIHIVQGQGEGRGKWNRRLLKLLRAEQAVAERLNHPNIIRIFETVIEADEAYVVMEYFAGESLEAYTSFDKLLPVHRVVSLVFKCCLALDHAFKNGIIHRDIKPANIMIDDQDNVKITDFAWR